eukprot:6146707-Amphidinium_carterae.1
MIQQVHGELILQRTLVHSSRRAGRTGLLFLAPTTNRRQSEFSSGWLWYSLRVDDRYRVSGQHPERTESPENNPPPEGKTGQNW